MKTLVAVATRMRPDTVFSFRVDLYTWRRLRQALEAFQLSCNTVTAATTLDHVDASAILYRRTPTNCRCRMLVKAA